MNRPRHAAQTPNRWIPSPNARRWAYGVAVAVVALLTTLGLLVEPVAAAILDVIAALVGISALTLAEVNTPRGD